MKQEGIIFNIQRYTVHDGPGIRTELFLKGCPLWCRWCGNPESQNLSMEPGVYQIKCIGEDKCGCCKSVCPAPESLIFKAGKLVSIDRNQCIGCMACTEICPADAVKAWGKSMTAEAAMDVIRRDIDYYQSSQGGVTVSGGEPLVQADFTAELLKRCKEEKIHTCLESTFCTDWHVIEKVIPYADLVITDIKHMNPDIHRKYTGVSNQLILENIQRLADLKKEMILRIPVIPNVNDDMENISVTADFILGPLKNRVQRLQLLGFMRLGEEKYASLGRPYDMEHVNVDRKAFNAHIKKLADYFNDRGICCTAGTTAKENGGMKK